MKINVFWVELTDVSAKKEALHTTALKRTLLSAINVTACRKFTAAVNKMSTVDKQILDASTLKSMFST